MLRARCRTWVTGRNAGELNLSFLLLAHMCFHELPSGILKSSFPRSILSSPVSQVCRQLWFLSRSPTTKYPARQCPPPRCSSFFSQSVIQDYLGPATELSIANHISACHGPSGSNVEYALKLAVALERLGVFDPHVRAVARHLNSMGFSADVSK